MTLVGWCPGGRPVPDMLARYPRTRAVRIFVGPGDALPAWDGPILGPAVAANVVVHLSFKTNTTPEVLAWAARKPAGILLLLTYAHEPEQQKYGDPTPEQFHARWAELLPAFDGHPMRPEILLGPVYTRYWWEHNAGDLRWLLKVPVDFIGWDVYNSGVSYRTPDDLLTVPRAIAARTGLPYLLAELGAIRVELDFDGTERSAWMHAMVDAARADGALTACWYHREAYDLTRADSVPEQQTWRELILEEPVPTYSQLQAEPYWGREVVTPAMVWLGDEMCRRTGRPREAAGTKGDRYHLRGAHRSQEWIKRSVYCTNRTYTVQTGLGPEMERWVAGFDFTPGTVDDMIAQSKRLMAAMKAGQLDEVREMYGNVDGDQVVDGWDNLHDRAASSDSSHLWHWHLSIDRAHCNDQKLMERILAVALGDPSEEDMPTADEIATAVLGRTYRDYNLMTDGKPALRTVAAILMDARTDAAKAVAGLRTLVELVARESASPDEVRALLAALPQPAPVDVDEQEIVAGILATLTPQAIAAAMTADQAKQVADELARRLASSTTPQG